MKILKNIILVSIFLSFVNSKKKWRNRINISKKQIKRYQRNLGLKSIAQKALNFVKSKTENVKRVASNKMKSANYAVSSGNPDRLENKKIKFLTKLINQEKQNIFKTKRKAMRKYTDVLENVNNLKMTLHTTTEEFNFKIEKINDILRMGIEAEAKEDEIEHHKMDEVLNEERELEKKAEQEVAEEMLLEKVTKDDELNKEEELNIENELDSNIKQKDNEQEEV